MRAIFLVLVAASAAWAQSDLSGDWKFTAQGAVTPPNIMRLTLKAEGEKLTGWLGGQPIEGSVRGVEIELGAAPFRQAGSADLTGTCGSRQLRTGVPNSSITAVAAVWLRFLLDNVRRVGYIDVGLWDRARSRSRAWSSVVGDSRRGRSGWSRRWWRVVLA